MCHLSKLSISMNVNRWYLDSIQSNQSYVIREFLHRLLIVTLTESTCILYLGRAPECLPMLADAVPVINLYPVPVQVYYQLNLDTSYQTFEITVGRMEIKDHKMSVSMVSCFVWFRCCYRLTFCRCTLDSKFVAIQYKNCNYIIYI